MKDTFKWALFDAEGDALEATKFHCLSFEDESGDRKTLTAYSEIRDFFSRYECFVGHNIARWDIPNLERVVGQGSGLIASNALIIDTLAISWYLEPDRPRHGLESYGEDYGVPKPKIDDWQNLTLDEYIHRCETDREINIRLWKDQFKKLHKIYQGEGLIRFLRYLYFKMYSARLAEESGWKLDIEKVRESVERLTKERDDKTEALRRVMPGVPVVTSYKPPKRRYNSDGQFSLLGQRWQDRLDERGLPSDYDGTIDVITKYDEPNPQSSDQIKKWLFSLGWKPRTIKYDRNKKTGEIREIPQIGLPNGGGICESVKELYEQEPGLEHLDGLGIVKHRLGLLNGYLRDVHRRSDGYYLRACVAGLTNTLRFKHAEIVNLPKLEKLYGIDIRGPLIAPDGHELCGSDMSSLEDRIKQHFIFPHDPDYVRELMRDDYDPHLDLALMAGAVTAEQVAAYTAGDKVVIKLIKPIRSIHKNGNYACQYGAGVSRLAITCGCDEETARRVHTAYWKRNWAIKKIMKEQTIRTVDGQKWLFNPVSKFWYSLRTDKDIFSTLVQGLAAYCFDTWLAFVVKKRPQLTGQFHDEFILTVRKGHRDEVKEFLLGCIDEVNDMLKLNRELAIDIQFGDTYAEIH